MSHLFTLKKKKIENINLWRFYFAVLDFLKGEIQKRTKFQTVKLSKIPTSPPMNGPFHLRKMLWVFELHFYFSNFFASLYRLISFDFRIYASIIFSLFILTTQIDIGISHLCVCFFHFFRLVASFAFECFEFAIYRNAKSQNHLVTHPKFSRTKRWIDDFGNNLTNDVDRFPCLKFLHKEISPKVSFTSISHNGHMITIYPKTKAFK